MGESAKKDAEIKLRRLEDLQPSQLYINREKLRSLQSGINFSNPNNIPPIPIKRLDGRWVMTDGHTRALAAHLAGSDRIPTLLDEDQLDWEAYQICVDWCREAGITKISDLEKSVIDSDAFELRWIARCRRMHEDLAKERS